MTPLSDVATYSKALRRRFWICDFLLFYVTTQRKTRQAKWSWTRRKLPCLVFLMIYAGPQGDRQADLGRFSRYGFWNSKTLWGLSWSEAWPTLDRSWTPLPNKYSETGHEWCDCIAFNILLLASNFILWLIHAHGKSNYDICLMFALRHKLWF